MFDFSILSHAPNLLKSVKDLIGIFQSAFLFQEKNQEKRFEEIIKPMHNAFREVHIDYAKMFLNLKQELPEEISNGIYSVPGQKQNFVKVKAIEHAKSLVRKFEIERGKKIGARDWIRNNSKAIFSSLKDQNEQKYFYSLAVYFLDAQFIKNPDDTIVSVYTEMLSQQGGDAVFDTPSFKLLRDIKELDTVEEIHELVDKEITNLNERCQHVISSYQTFN